MEVQTTPLEGLLLIRPPSYEDNRGFFSETWNQRTLNEAVGEEVSFVQANQSRSHAGVLRGLHFQAPPHAQGKLVRVSEGKVLDVAVDLRVGSPTFGQHHAALLSRENRWQFFIPAGFAHGFLTMEDETSFHYLCTNFYCPESEGALLWSDPDLGIDWGVEAPMVSEKDMQSSLFSTFDSPFVFAPQAR